MAPLKKIYLEELARIQDRINSLFEQALLTSDYEDREGGLPGTWAPSVDVLETEDGYFDLGAPVDVDGISAAFEQGVLRVLIPKRAGGATPVEISEEGG
jgi:HSP20 family molecular chaperone IbpA